MNEPIIKEVRIKGDKGDAGDETQDRTIPTNAIIYYDGTTAPTGYLEIGGNN